MKNIDFVIRRVCKFELQIEVNRPFTKLRILQLTSLLLGLTKKLWRNTPKNAFSNKIWESFSRKSTFCGQKAKRRWNEVGTLIIEWLSCWWHDSESSRIRSTASTTHLGAISGWMKKLSPYELREPYRSVGKANLIRRAFACSALSSDRSVRIPHSLSVCLDCCSGAESPSTSAAFEDQDEGRSLTASTVQRLS